MNLYLDSYEEEFVSVIEGVEKFTKEVIEANQSDRIQDYHAIVKQKINFIQGMIRVMTIKTDMYYLAIIQKATWQLLDEIIEQNNTSISRGLSLNIYAEFLKNLKVNTTFRHWKNHIVSGGHVNRQDG